MKNSLVLLIDNLYLTIAIVAVAVVVGLIILYCLLYFFVLRFKRMRKSLAILEERYERSHQLLFGPGLQYVNRLESISAMNLTYVEEHNVWRKKYTAIRDASDAQVSFSLNNLREFIEEKHFKEFKESYPEAKEEVERFEKEVNEFTEALSNKFKAEDDSKTLLLSLKDEARQVKAAYIAREGDLELVEVSFNAIYDKLEKELANASNLIDDAKYSDAQSVLEGTVSQVLKALNAALIDLPTICISLTRLLPEKTNELENRYNDLVNNGYPLGHLLSSDEPKKIRSKTALLKEKAIKFDLSGLKKQTDELLNHIEDLFAGFDKEVSSRAAFDEMIGKAYKENEYVATKNVDLTSAFPSLEAIYVVPENYKKEFEEIGELVLDSSSTKRLLDTYLHSSAKQPFSVLLQKATSLYEQSKIAHEKIDAFFKFLLSLKDGAERSYKALNDFFMKLNNARICVRNMNVPVLVKSYEGRFVSCFNLIDNLDKVLKQKPIDVTQALDILNELTTSANTLIEEINKLDEERLEAEKAIVVANRQRLSFSETHNLLRQAEGFYFKGDFIRAKEAAVQAKEAANLALNKR